MSLLRVPRPSIRLRLTAFYTAIFLAMGTVLLGLSYAVVRHEFRYESARVHVAFEEVVPRRSATRPSRTLKVRIAPGIPLENAAPVRTLDADARFAYGQARNAYAAQIRAANNRALKNVLLWFAGALLLLTLASVYAGWVVARHPPSLRARRPRIWISRKCSVITPKCSAGVRK